MPPPVRSWRQSRLRARSRACRQQRAQHPPAVHRKRRDHVEQRQEHVHGGEPVEHADGGLSTPARSAGSSDAPNSTSARRAITTLTAGPRSPSGTPRCGFSGCARAAPRRRSAAASRSGVVTPKPRAMKMWPNSCATTQANSSSMKTRRVPGGLRRRRRRNWRENPDEKQQERDVHADDRAGDRADIDRPTHDEPR